MRFKLNMGQYIQTDPDGFERVYVATGPGTIVESPSDLTRFNGTPDQNGQHDPLFIKFEKMPDATPLTPQFGMVLRTPDQLSAGVAGQVQKTGTNQVMDAISSAVKQGFAKVFTDLDKAPKSAPEQPAAPLQHNPLETLQEMSVEDLRKFAADEEIPLGKAKSKAEILEVLRAEMTVAT